MGKHIVLILVGVLIVAGLLITTVSYQVDYNEICLVKTFGKTTQVVPGRTLGNLSGEPGLHWKWPWPVERVVSYDSRWQTLEDPNSELQLKNKQIVMVTLYCNWRIANPEKFNQSVETFSGGEDKIRNILQTYKGTILGRMQMDDLVNTAPQKMLLEQVENQILDAAKAKVRDDYGIELAEVGMRGLGLTQNVSAKVIEAQIKERERDVSSFESEGQASAQAIRDRAKAASEQIMAFADRKASSIETQGMAAAAGYYGQFKEAPELSIFLRYLETMKKGLQNRTQFLLDGSEIPALKWLREGPSHIELPSAVSGAASTVPASDKGGKK